MPDLDITAVTDADPADLLAAFDTMRVMIFPAPDAPNPVWLKGPDLLKLLSALIYTSVLVTSAASMAPSTGTKSFTVNDTLYQRAGFLPGQAVIITPAAGSGEWMLGTVTSYDQDTGVCVTNITHASGATTTQNWNITNFPIAGPLADAVNTALGG